MLFTYFSKVNLTLINNTSFVRDLQVPSEIIPMQPGCSIILAIESSCDETAASVCKDGLILSNIIASQTVHEKYGGVVPELASRAHMENIVPVVDEAIKKSRCEIKRN